MPVFPSPTPIDLAVNVPVGSIEVAATARADTVVTVSPTNPARTSDTRAAETTRIEFDGERLTVVVPKPGLRNWLGPTESVDVLVELPIGSRMSAEISVGAVRTSGHLSATRVKNSSGSVHLESTGDLWMRAGHGNATIGSADGNIDVTADHGQIRVDSVSGDAVVQASHGSVFVGTASGDLHAKLAYGDLDVTAAFASVAAKTAYGAIELHEVWSGSIDVESGYGEVNVGVRTGVPAWLDLASKEGRVRNHLEGDSAPAESERSVAVRVRTQYGDINVRRAP